MQPPPVIRDLRFDSRACSNSNRFPKMPFRRRLAQGHALSLARRTGRSGEQPCHDVLRIEPENPACAGHSPAGADRPASARATRWACTQAQEVLPRLTRTLTSASLLCGSGSPSGAPKRSSARAAPGLGPCGVSSCCGNDGALRKGGSDSSAGNDDAAFGAGNACARTDHGQQTDAPAGGKNWTCRWSNRHGQQPGISSGREIHVTNAAPSRPPRFEPGRRTFENAPG